MPEDAEFAGRVVAVWVRDPAQGAVLENVSVRPLGPRTFLVGQVADEGKGPDPRIGLTYWFPVEDVLMLIVYPDLQTARAAYAARGQAAGNPPTRSWWPWRK